jgi:hypothetical protein
LKQSRNGEAQSHHVRRIQRRWSGRTRKDRARHLLEDSSTLHYGGKAFQSLKGSGFKANYFDVATGEHYWISGPRKDGTDALYATNVPTEIDEDVREEYWSVIRKKPSLKARKHT